MDSSLPTPPVDLAAEVAELRARCEAQVRQLAELAAAAREIPLTASEVICGELDRAPLIHVLSGEVRLDCGTNPPLLAGPGSTIGATQALAGVPLGWRATVTRDGLALRLGRDELFDVLADHVELMQALFTGALRAQEATASAPAPPASTA